MSARGVFLFMLARPFREDASDDNSEACVSLSRRVFGSARLSLSRSLVGREAKLLLRTHGLFLSHTHHTTRIILILSLSHHLDCTRIDYRASRQLTARETLGLSRSHLVRFHHHRTLFASLAESRCAAVRHQQTRARKKRTTSHICPFAIG